MIDYTATYSPDDNKLRLYASERLDKELYNRVKAAGFKWAPKQGLFVAPMWTPSREDLAIELAGEIGDEDTSLLDRAEERSERFEDYSDKRAKDAEAAHAGVKSISDNIPMGQPILVGHHSEKRARKDAQRIENGMRKAVKMWETSEYWERRAAGAIRHAKYKERPEVRARRIKKIEAAKRKNEKETKNANKLIEMWGALNEPGRFKKKTGEETTPLERALYFSNYFDHGYWSDLRDEKITPDEAAAASIASHTKWNAYRVRWLAHYNNRLAYEKAMLADQGASDLLKPKARPKQPPLCNYRAPEGISVENRYHKGEFSIYPQVEMTKAEYAKIHTDYKGTHIIENSHRIRAAMHRDPSGLSHVCVFLTDSKVHKKPDPIEKMPVYHELPAPHMPREEAPKAKERRENIANMKTAIKEGVQVAVAPQLFPTPEDLAEKMVQYANIEEGDRILEPSAGTGNLIKAMFKAQIEKGLNVVAVELNSDLAIQLSVNGLSSDVVNADFLECSDLGKFDKIIMNPPFGKGADIKHIQHAATMLKPGGVLVALCANGPRQQEQLQDLCSHWEDLPAGSFKEAGTGINVALLTIFQPFEKEVSLDDLPPSFEKSLKEAQAVADSLEPKTELTPEGEQFVVPGAEKDPELGPAQKSLW